MSITSYNVICRSPDELSCCVAVLEDGYHLWEGKIVRFFSHYIINTRAFPKCRTFPVSRFLSLSSRLLPFTQWSTVLFMMTFISQRRFYLATRSVRLRPKTII